MKLKLIEFVDEELKCRLEKQKKNSGVIISPWISFKCLFNP